MGLAEPTRMLIKQIEQNRREFIEKLLETTARCMCPNCQTFMKREGVPEQAELQEEGYYSVMTFWRCPKCNRCESCYEMTPPDKPCWHCKREVPHGD